MTKERATLPQAALICLLCMLPKDRSVSVSKGDNP